MSDATAVIAGPDEAGLAAALEAEGFDVTRIDDVPTRPELETAGITDADLFVLTDSAHPTAIPIVRDLTGGIRIVCYTRDSLPEFVSGQLDLAVDPQLMPVDIVAEELSNGLA